MHGSMGCGETAGEVFGVSQGGNKFVSRKDELHRKGACLAFCSQRFLQLELGELNGQWDNQSTCGHVPCGGGRGSRERSR